MNKKDFEKGFELFLQQREKDTDELAIIIASMGIPVVQSVEIAHEIYKKGWRKTENK